MLNTIMLLGVLTGILLGIGWLFFGIAGLTAALALSILLNFCMYWFSDRIVLGLYRTKPTNDSRLNSIVEGIARNSRIPKPRVYIVDSNVPNAFATGRNPKHSAVAVTRGLMGLNDDEIEGVLGHEIGHIRNRDTLVATMAATIAGAISYLAQIGYYSMFFSGNEQRGGGNLLGFILILIFAPLAALLVRLAISRAREYRADYYGVLVTKKPEGLVSALRKISEKVQQNPARGNSATSHLWFANPFGSDRFTGLFSTHPPIEKRIKRIQQMYA